MTAWQEQRQLHEIEAELAASAPRLAGMLRTFTRLTEGERPSGVERFPPRARRLRGLLSNPGLMGGLVLMIAVMSGMLLAVLTQSGGRQCPGRPLASHALTRAGAGAPANAGLRPLTPAGSGCPVYITNR
jgi:hypothetical protein